MHQRIEVGVEPPIPNLSDEHSALGVEPAVELDEACPFDHRGLASCALDIAGTERGSDAPGLVLERGFKSAIDMVHQDVNVVQVAEDFLQTLASLYDWLSLIQVGAYRLEQVPEPLAHDACIMELFRIVNPCDLPELRQEVCGVRVHQIGESLSETDLRALVEQVLLALHQGETLFEPIGETPKCVSQLPVQGALALAPTRHQRSGQPVEPCQVLGGQAALLLGQPLEGDLGFSSTSGGALNVAKLAAILLAYR